MISSIMVLPWFRQMVMSLQLGRQKTRKMQRNLKTCGSFMVANASAHRIAIDQKLNEKFFPSKKN
jgi:hypothetical protein